MSDFFCSSTFDNDLEQMEVVMTDIMTDITLTLVIPYTALDEHTRGKVEAFGAGLEQAFKQGIMGG